VVYRYVGCSIDQALFYLLLTNKINSLIEMFGTLLVSCLSDPEPSILNPKNKMMKYIIVVVMLFFAPLTAQAGAIEKLKTFIAATHSAQANFTQVVLDQDGKRMQSASGVMQFQRPGRFRWTYQTPYEQIIVGDGAKFWLYDKDLNQVTVKKLDAALGSSPAALLAGSNEIERGFVLKDVGSRDGLDWLQATPKAKDSSFSAVSMGFDAQAGLVVMELNDTFGHKTVLRFSAMQRNPKLSAGQFQFTPPADADIVSD
jgi:outer membrane lipoprotein carrier protein